MFRFAAIVATLCLHPSKGILQQQQEPDVATLLQVGNRAKGNRQQMHQFNDGDFQGWDDDPLQLTIRTLGENWASSPATDIEIQCWQGTSYPPKNHPWLKLPPPDKGDAKFEKGGITTHTFPNVLQQDCTQWLSLRSKNKDRWGVDWIRNSWGHYWPQPYTCVGSDPCKYGFWLEETCPNALPANIPCYSQVSFTDLGRHKIKLEFVTLNIAWADSNGNVWLKFGHDKTWHGVEGFKKGESTVVWLSVFFGVGFSNRVTLDFDSTDRWGVNGIKIEDKMVAREDGEPWKPFYMDKGAHNTTYKGYEVWKEVSFTFTEPN